MLIFTKILRKLIRYISMESYLFNGQCMAGHLPRETAQHLRSRPPFFVSSCKAPCHILLNHGTSQITDALLLALKNCKQIEIPFKLKYPFTWFMCECEP